MDIIKHYVDIFNSADEEIYINDISNSDVYEWMKQEVPIFECPDKDIERTYYFRFWTYRKHIKSTENGIVITEFLPRVPWAQKHNTINAATGQHVYEGRWLRNSQKYLKDYILFMLTKSDKCPVYSVWLIDAAYKYATATGDFDFGDLFLENCDKYFELWEKEHSVAGGGFWSIDNFDAMEYSVSGTTTNLIRTRGIRPTLNSYMCADAYAIAKFSKIYGNSFLEEKYLKKHQFLKKYINENLYEDGFYRAYHYFDNENPSDAIKKDGTAPRELIGYIPFMFDIPAADRYDCFNLLTDENVFFSEYGLTTVEQCSARYLYEANHENLWNGYIWPFATSQTLTALKNAAQKSENEKFKSDFYMLMHQYAKMHKRTNDDHEEICWIDEVLDPRNADWSSRTILKNRGWPEQKGGYERGKDYNHSTFCDLVISGLVGINTDGPEIEIKPLAPKTWEYFKLSRVKIRGEEYEITYDKTGKKYSKGVGLVITKKSL